MRHIAESRAGEESDLMPRCSAEENEHDDKKGHNLITCGVAIEGRRKNASDESATVRTEHTAFQPNVASHTIT
jgi:hypothetical protein